MVISKQTKKHKSESGLSTPKALKRKLLSLRKKCEEHIGSLEMMIFLDGMTLNGLSDDEREHGYRVSRAYDMSFDESFPTDARISIMEDALNTYRYEKYAWKHETRVEPKPNKRENDEPSILDLIINRRDPGFDSYKYGRKRKEEDQHSISESVAE